jgi:hypothetical protein
LLFNKINSLKGGNFHSIKSVKSQEKEMEEEKGVSIGEIFKVIFKRLWWVIGVTAAFLIIFVLVVQFVYNPSKETYSVSYEFNYPNSETNQYPDGTSFRRSDLISLATLQEIVSNGNGKYSNVNIEDMVANDDIAINVVEPESTTSTEVTYYTVVVKAKYFNDSDQAKNFIKDIIEYPKNKINKMVAELEYSSNLTGYVNATIYSDKINYLQAQRSYILSLYDNLIDLYGDFYKINDKSLKDYRIALSKIFDSEDETEILNEINEKRYVYDYERYLSTADTRLQLLDRQYQYNQTRLDELTALRNELISQYGTGANVEVESYNNEIVSLFKQQKDIDESKDDINKTVEAIKNYDKATVDAFNSKLDGYATQLEEQTSIFKQVNVAVYSDKTEVLYKSNKIEADGGLNIILAAVIGLVVGFILVSVVICIIDMPKYIKERDSQEKALASGGDGEKENN